MAKVTTSFGDLAIVPYIAQAPVTETLEYLTDVMVSHNGTEQRIALRKKPRQYFNYKITVNSPKTTEVFNTIYGAIRDKWAVPLWTQSQNIGNITAGTTTLACITDLYEFRDNSLALLFNFCGQEWQVIEIATVTPSALILSTACNAFNDAWLVPVRIGHIVAEIQKATKGSNDTLSITYDIEDTPDIAESVPTQYSGSDIYFEQPLLDGEELARSVEKRLDIVDFDLGKVARRSPWLYSQFGTQSSSIIENATEMLAFKRWFARRVGKFRQYWQPTFEVNMRVLNANFVASTLVIATDSYIEYALSRNHIAIQSIDGLWHIRTVSNVTQINTERIQMTLNIPLNLETKNIKYVSYLGLNRLDTDRVEINWGTNNIAKINVRILELKP